MATSGTPAGQAGIIGIQVIYESADFPRDEEGRRQMALATDFDENTIERLRSDGLDRRDFEKMVKSAILTASRLRKEMVAMHIVDYDQFTSDSDYLDRIDRVVEGMKLVDVRIEGQTRRYAVDGVYTDGRQQWSDWEYASCQAEAEWRGSIRMAENEFGHGRSFRKLMELAKDMAVTAYPEPVSRDEYRELLSAVAEQARRDGYASEALSKAAMALDYDESLVAPESLRQQDLVATDAPSP